MGNGAKPEVVAEGALDLTPKLVGGYGAKPEVVADGALDLMPKLVGGQ